MLHYIKISAITIITINSILLLFSSHEIDSFNNSFIPITIVIITTINFSPTHPLFFHLIIHYHYFNFAFDLFIIGII